MFKELAQVEDTMLGYLPRLKTPGHLMYVSLTIAVLAGLAMLPFVKTDISIHCTGIIRPLTERTEIKPVISGIIDTIYYSEGDTVLKSAVLLRLKDLNTRSKMLVNSFAIKQRTFFIADLTLLCATDFSKPASDLALISQKLKSPLYKGEAATFLHQKTEQDIQLRKVVNEEEMNRLLAIEKIISPKEFFDLQIQTQRQTASNKAVIQQQISKWQQELATYKLELSQYLQQGNQIETDAGYFLIKSPVSGVVQGINNRYPGGYLQLNEAICVISPIGEVIAECLVPATEIGLIKNNQAVILQIDAFDYHYFGVVSATVQKIDKDYSLINNRPAFKVRCKITDTQMQMKNGFLGEITKGLTFQCRFIVAKRSLWQLLWDKIEDWLNPTSYIKS